MLTKFIIGASGEGPRNREFDQAVTELGLSDQTRTKEKTHGARAETPIDALGVFRAAMAELESLTRRGEKGPPRHKTQARGDEKMPLKPEFKLSKAVTTGAIPETARERRVSV